MTRSMRDGINAPEADVLQGVPGSSRPSEATRRSAGRTCLVAVDGSEESVQALVWGFRYATDRGMCVEVLTVWPSHRSVLIHEVPGHVSAARWSARTAQEDAIRQAFEEVLDGPITAARLENADAGTAIVAASARCDLVVLGSNSNDTSHSLTDRVLAQAACEVVVVGSSDEVIAATASVPTLAVRSGPATRRSSRPMTRTRADSPLEGGRHRWPWVPGSGTAVGLVLGAALGSTIVDSLALATGIGVLLGSVADLHQLHK